MKNVSFINNTVSEQAGAIMILINNRINMIYCKF
jgi:hypothetical protein